ncbi:hypothetical protein ABIC11_001059 [Pseudomonas oryzihabitans]
MPDITNTSGTPIGLPDGTVIPPKQTAPVDNWDDFKDRANLKHYVQHGVLVVAASAGGQPSSSSPNQGASETEEEQQKRDLRGKLDLLGIQMHPNTGLEKLRKALAEAEVAKSRTDVIEALKAKDVEFDETASLDELKAKLEAAE